MRATKILIGAVALSVLAAPAFAQRKTDEQKKAEAELRKQEDQLYRSSTATIQTQDAIVVDPWSNMRGDNEPAAGNKKKR